MLEDKTVHSAVFGDATPMVSGLCGLIWTVNPNLTREEVIGIIMDTTKTGNLDAEAAVKEAMVRGAEVDDAP